MRRVVVVGASLTGLRTVEAIRQAGFTGALTIVGEEPHAPYNRPPLTKAALLDGPDLSVLALPTASDLDATWTLGVSATGLDRTRREVLIGTGEALAFDGLVIATGASARRLPDDLGGVGVHHIRTLDDATTLHRALAEPGRSVLVIGAGFLGSEVASTAASLGHRVTLVEATAGPMLGALGPEVSDYCARLHRRRPRARHRRGGRRRPRTPAPARRHRLAGRALGDRGGPFRDRGRHAPRQGMPRPRGSPVVLDRPARRQIRGIGLPGWADTTTIGDGAVEDDRFLVTRTRAGRLIGAIAVNNTPALFRYRSELESASRTALPTS